ncbi:hypothetical protein IMSAG249_00103 [Lachnospiraceae bacterium]|nr:hypothetical protein IMSAG249_00103 [Lachnospiraceae bacterium]
MTNNLKGTQELQRRYGHLLDKYVDNAHADYSTKQEREEEIRNRYGHLLNYAKPDHRIYEDIIMAGDACRRMRQQRADEYEQANIRRQERIENEKREQQERIDRNNAFVNSYLEKKEGERKAAEEKRKEAEREQKFLNSIQRMINAKEEASEMIARTNAMLKRNEENRKAHEEKMEWYRKQERKG